VISSLSAAVVSLALVAAPEGGDGDAARVTRSLPAERLRRTDIPIALVLSGGVSLGSYEAGLSWAVVRFSRGAGSRPRAVSGAPRLVAVTGASAGSVNALPAAILWCAEPGPGEDSVDHNLLHDLWTAVGVEGLLPDDPGRFAPGDALLSSRPLLEGFAEFERRVDAWAAARRFRPDCRLPVGLTVTRATAAEHEIAGLTLRTQRFALPWRVEVSADGGARVMSQPIAEAEARPDILEIARRGEGEPGAALSWPQVMQGMLASSAFPVAFRPRELCDCSARCPPANQVKSGTCEGPRGPITHLGCPARSPEGEPLTLCSHPYVDGGIFDNTPVGLGVDLTQSVSTTHPLQPVTYVYIDPDLRRLRPVGSEDGASASPSPTRGLGQNLEEAARLASELVATARTENLSSSLRTGPWNATTRRLLYQTAASLLSFATVERNAAAAVGRSRADPDLHLGESEPSPAARAALGSALLRCFAGRPRDADSVRRCARELADATAGRAAPGDGSPTTEADVIGLAEAMKDGASEMLRRHPTRSARDAELFAQEMRIGAVGMTFLADEMTRVAQGTTPEPTLKQFRGALLDTIQLGRALGVEVAHLANAAVIEQLEALGADPAAAQASATILAAPDVLFVPDELQPVLQSAAHGPAADAALRSLRELVAVGPALQAEIVRLNRLARTAEALQQSRTERALILSSRFAPIAGSQLGKFGAFLDRPLREYDYVAGVYDASHVIAVALCEAGAIGGAPRPVRDRRSSNELDLHGPDTQRCVGRALETVLQELDVDASSTAGHVFRMLARAELDASLGDAGARRLEREPAWAWLTDRSRAAQDAAVVTVADVLLSSRVPCGPDASSRCIRELSFDELLSALRERRYQARDEEMRALVDDPDAWTRRTARRLVDRSYARELASPASPDLARAILVAHRVGEMWLRGFGSAGASPHLSLDPSTIPTARIGSLDRHRLAAHLLPYRLDLDVARGGVSASWVDPALWLGPRTSLVAEITPISYEARHGSASSSLAVLPKLHVAGLSIGAGPKASLRWRDGTLTAGAYLRAAAFQQRLSLAIGTDALSGRDRALFFTIGVSDVNGMLFWLLGG
jgi:predicted acylesterase/phospholipase RssA